MSPFSQPYRSSSSSKGRLSPIEPQKSWEYLLSCTVSGSISINACAVVLSFRIPGITVSPKCILILVPSSRTLVGMDGSSVCICAPSEATLFVSSISVSSLSSFPSVSVSSAPGVLLSSCVASGLLPSVSFCAVSALFPQAARESTITHTINMDKIFFIVTASLVVNFPTV